MFGILYFVPVLRTRSTIVAVNLGGALVPAALSVCLIIHDRLGWWALAAVAIVGVVVHLVARPVPGLGIAVLTAAAPGVAGSADVIECQMAVGRREWVRRR